MYVPWSKVASWHCTACGICCEKFKPKLTFYEYLKLKNTGFVEEKAGRYYIKKINGKCPFQTGNLCSLQNTIKPLSCKVFPFLVRKKGDNEAFYEYDGEEYYVYVSLGCPNVVLHTKAKRNLPNTTPIEKLVKEAIEIVTGRKRSVELITCNVSTKQQSLLDRDLNQLHAIRRPQRIHRKT